MWSVWDQSLLGLIRRIITITTNFYWVGPLKCDHNQGMITLIVINIATFIEFIQFFEEYISMFLNDTF